MKHLLLFMIGIGMFETDLAGQEAREITLRVVEDNGTPIEGARAVISFVGAHEDGEHIGPTDREGCFSAQGKALAGIYLAARKDGYYPARFDTSRFDRLPIGQNVRKDLVLPRLIKPVSLFAKRSGGWGAALTIPVQGEWVGYDFQMGDWIRPHGNGKIADVRFRFKTSFNGWKSSDKDMANSRQINSDLSESEIRFFYGKWDGELEISFPNPKEGLCEEKDRFLAYSTMKMPHSAPADGYQPEWRYMDNTYSPTNARENVGFFLRTRVRLDDEGRIISANYSKVIGDFSFSPANGAMRFVYYFNPVPNDRNLEFDPKRNLFPADFPGADISDP